MASMPWVKIYTEMLDDVKMSRLNDQQKWRFVQFILLAAECDAAGAIVTGDSRMTLEDVSWRLRCDSKILQKDVTKLIEVGLLTDEDCLAVAKFSDRQGPTQAEKREIWRKRQQERRKRAKSEAVLEDSSMSHSNVSGVEEIKIKSKTLSRQAAPADSPKHPERQELIKYFLIKTGIPAPKTDNAHIKATQKRWWTPMDDILELAGGDAGRAEELIDLALARLRDVTITSPQSVVETAKAVIADNHRSPPDIHQQLAEEGYVVHKAD